jgi:hypothetical protein
MKIVKEKASEKASCLTCQETYGPVLTDRGDTMGRNRFFLAFTYSTRSVSNARSVKAEKGE